MSKKLKRNELDIIITDLLPVEISELFTFRNFYSYLTNEKEELKKIENEFMDIKYSSKKLFSDSGIYASPLKFDVYKSNESKRTLSIVNPISALQIYVFVKLYSDSLLNRLEEQNVYSVRYHTKKKSLYYIKKDKQLIEYADFDFIEGIESTGMFFDIKKYRTIKELYRSDKWFSLNTENKYFAKIDYQSCFESIYTHTFKWILSNNVIDSRNFSNTNNVFSVADRLLQQINSSISNGILVGPEFSRLMAELLLQQIDKEVFNSLVQENKINKEDYEILRYVDDLFIFTDNKKLLDDIIQRYSSESKKYQLRINEKKTIKGNLPHIWTAWLRDLKDYIKEIDSKHFLDEFHSVEKEYRMKSRNLLNKRHITSLKEDFQRIVASYPNDVDKIVRYVFGFYANKINKKYDIKLFKSEVIESEIKGLFDFLFFHYSYAPTFRNTKHLITFIVCVDNMIVDGIMENVIQELIEKYSFALKKVSIHDFSNILLVLSKYNVKLSYVIEESIWNRVIESQDPIQICNFMIYAKYNHSYYIRIIKAVETIIKNKLSLITSDVNIFLYEEFWFIIIFSDFSDFTDEVKDIIAEKIELIKSEKDVNYGRLRNLLYSYLTDNNYKNKFIKWTPTADSYIDNITFKTFEQTLFNDAFDFDYEWEY